VLPDLISLLVVFDNVGNVVFGLGLIKALCVKLKKWIFALVKIELLWPIIFLS